MVKKNWTIASHNVCEACPAVETADHIILGCKEEQQVWRHLNLEELAVAVQTSSVLSGMWAKRPTLSGI